LKFKICYNVSDLNDEIKQSCPAPDKNNEGLIYSEIILSRKKGNIESDIAEMNVAIESFNKNNLDGSVSLPKEVVIINNKWNIRFDSIY